MNIRLETPIDFFAVEQLYDLVFGQSRTLLSSYRLRTGVKPLQDLCFLVEQDGYPIAAIRYWPVYVEREDGERWASLLLGPIAVHPTFQGEGLGHVLIHASLSQAITIGWRRVFLVGDAKYYEKFGFRSVLGATIEFPDNTDPMRCLERSLVPGGLDQVSGRLVPYI